MTIDENVRQTDQSHEKTYNMKAVLRLVPLVLLVFAVTTLYRELLKPNTESQEVAFILSVSLLVLVSITGAVWCNGYRIGVTETTVSRYFFGVVVWTENRSTIQKVAKFLYRSGQGAAITFWVDGIAKTRRIQPLQEISFFISSISPTTDFGNSLN